METLEYLHRKMDNLEDLHGIVKTMKALSAANIHQYDQAVGALDGYYRTIEMGLHILLKDYDPASFNSPRPRTANRLGAIIFGSDHGLCGRFNEDIALYATERMGAVPADSTDRQILAIGARVAENLEDAGEGVDEVMPVPASAAQITSLVERILMTIEDWRETGKVHYVYLFYNHPLKRSGYHPIGVELLPVNLQRFHRLEEERWPSRSLPTYTMNRQTLFQRLLDQYLFVLLFRACAESQASEHASRLVAMQSAERALDERLEDVTMNFRRVRQSLITSELLDLISGFETTGPTDQTN